MSVVESVKVWAEGIISTMGYPGIVLLTGLGSANIPIPSEVVLPFGGILVGKGEMDFNVVALTGTLGSVLGSLVSYGLGSLLGRDFLIKYGKYFFVRRSEIEHGEAWFTRYGLRVTLWGRFIPIIRSFVSLPAGIFRSNLGTFTLYAFLGSLPWCYFWTYIGLKVGQHWDVVEKNMKIVDGVIALGVAALIFKFFWSRKKQAVEPSS